MWKNVNRYLRYKKALVLSFMKVKKICSWVKNRFKFSFVWGIAQTVLINFTISRDLKTVWMWVRKTSSTRSINEIRVSFIGVYDAWGKKKVGKNISDAKNNVIKKRYAGRFLKVEKFHSLIDEG